MEEFPCGQRLVAVLGKAFRKRIQIRQKWRLLQIRAEEVNPGGMRMATCHEAGPRRVANRRLAMRVGEQRAAFSESIDVRRPRLGVTAKTAGPVVEIVDRNQEDVGAIVRLSKRKRQEWQKQGEQDFIHGWVERELDRFYLRQAMGCN